MSKSRVPGLSVDFFCTTYSFIAQTCKILSVNDHILFLTAIENRRPDGFRFAWNNYCPRTNGFAGVRGLRFVPKIYGNVVQSTAKSYIIYKPPKPNQEGDSTGKAGPAQKGWVLIGEVAENERAEHVKKGCPFQLTNSMRILGQKVQECTFGWKVFRILVRPSKVAAASRILMQDFNRRDEKGFTIRRSKGRVG